MEPQPQPLAAPQGAPRGRRTAVATKPAPGECCPHLHEAVELVGKRWTGAIVWVLLQERGPMRFSEVGTAIPQLSDRLLSERMKELEARGIVERQVHSDTPVRVEYELTTMGRDLGPALRELRRWAVRYLD
jgi:DNA-binding HxlR family transcriptional regulator